MKRWITSDTHFFHDKIAQYCNRPKDHSTIIAANLTKYVGPKDILYHLGDVTFGSYDTLAAILKFIPGKKVLVRGNHDRWTDSRYLELGFDMVADAIAIGDVLLTHKPIDPGPYAINLHGHLHNLGYSDIKSFREDYGRFGKDGRHILYAPELYDYRPVQIEKLVRR